MNPRVTSLVTYLLASLHFSATSLQAAEATQTVKKEVPKVGRIAGQVVAKGTGAAIKGAKVWTRRGTDVQTDELGGFVLDNMPPGRVYVHVTAPGWASRRQSVRLSPRQNIDDLKIVLAKGARIVGTLTDEQGRPLPGIRVSTFHFTGQPVRTDKDGRYVLDGVNPSSRGYSVHVKPDDYVWQSRSAPAFDGKDDVTVDFKLERGVTVSGTVADASGKPVVGAVVGTTNSQHMWDRIEAKTDARGRYTLKRVPPGDIVLSVLPKSHAAQILTLAGKESGSQVTRDFTIAPGVSVSGRVVDSSGNPMAGVSAGGIEFRGFRYLNRRAKTDKDGRFTLSHLPEGTLTIDFYGKGELRDQVVTAPSENLTFKVPLAGSIRGQVVDAETGKPITKFIVKLGFSKVWTGRVNGYSSSWSREGHTFADPKGHFDTGRETLTEDGGYRITAIAKGYAKLTLDPVMARSDRAAKRTVFRLTRGRTLRGLVVDRRGKPVGGATVRLFDRSGPIRLGDYDRDEDATEFETNERGEFSIPNVGPGPKRARVSHPEWGLKVIDDITPALKSGGRLEVTLAGPAGIEGFVYRGAKPVADADVSIYYAPPDGNLGRRTIQLHKDAKTDENGFFSFRRLPAGRYQVSHSKRWQRSGVNIRTKYVEVQEGETSFVALGGGGGAILTGKITDDKGLALAGVSVNILPLGQWEESAGDITGADGKYEIWDVEPGLYDVRLSRFRQRPGGG